MPSIFIGSSGLMTPLNSSLSVRIGFEKPIMYLSALIVKKVTSLSSLIINFSSSGCPNIIYDKGPTPSQKISGILPLLISKSVFASSPVLISGSNPAGPYVLL